MSAPPADLFTARGLLAELDWLADALATDTPLPFPGLLLTGADSPELLGIYASAVPQHHISALLASLHSSGARANSAETAASLALTLHAATDTDFASLPADQREAIETGCTNRLTTLTGMVAR